jgi:hypothetical protein
MKGHKHKDGLSNSYMRKFLKSAHEADPGYVVKGRNLRFKIDVRDRDKKTGESDRGKRLRSEVNKAVQAKVRKSKASKTSGR